MLLFDKEKNDPFLFHFNLLWLIVITLTILLHATFQAIKSFEAHIFSKLNSTTNSPYFMQMSLEANTINNKCIGRKHRSQKTRYNYVLSRRVSNSKGDRNCCYKKRQYLKTISSLQLTSKTIHYSLAKKLFRCNHLCHNTT